MMDREKKKAYMRKYMAEYRQKHGDKVRAANRERMRTFRQLNRERLNEERRERRARSAELKRQARAEARAKRLEEHPQICAHCGKVVEQPARGRRLYHAECAAIVNLEKTKTAARAKYKHKPKPSVCECCGQPLEQVVNGRRRFCPSCAEERQRERSRALKAQMRTEGPVMIVCSICGQQFEVARRPGGKIHHCPSCKAQRKAQRKARPKRLQHGPAERVVGSATRSAATSNGGMTSAQMRKVEADMRLPASDRYAASKNWTPKMRRYAEQLWYEYHRGRRE